MSFKNKKQNPEKSIGSSERKGTCLRLYEQGECPKTHKKLSPSGEYRSKPAVMLITNELFRINIK